MPVAPVTFVGRVGELDELTRRVADTATSGVGLITVTGASGIGKTALLRQLATRYPGAPWAAATSWEISWQGSVAAQLTQGRVSTDPVAAADELAKIVDVDSPTPLIVDDAHLSDLVSLRALSTLARHHRALPVLVILATDGSPLPVPDLTTDEITVPGLDRADVARIAAARGKVLAPSMVDRLTHHTAGNPRHVRALLDELPPDIWTRLDARLPAPREVRQRVAGVLAEADPAGRALTVALAILGEGASLAQVALFANIDEPLSALESAMSAGLLTSADTVQPQLRDPLTAAGILDVIGAQATAEAHLRAAEIVDDPVARMKHRVAATPTLDAELADEVDTLARTVGSDGAWSQAAMLFHDASRLSRDPVIRDERLTQSVDALVAAGDCTGAATLVPAVENLRETPRRNAVLGYLAIVRGRAIEAEIRLQRAWDIVNVERDPETAAFIAQRHVLHALAQCQGDQLVAWADLALELAERNSPAGVEAAAIRGLGLLAAGHPKRAAAAYDELHARVRHGAQAQRVGMGRGWVQLMRDDIDAARASLEGAVAAAALGGSTRITLWALAWLARTQFAMGEWDAAQNSVAQGRALAESSGIALVTPLLAWTAGQISALRGDWAAAQEAAQAASASNGEYAIMRIPAVLLKAEIAEARADYASVRRALEPLQSIAAGTSLQEPGYWPWVDTLANALVLQGDLPGADRLLGPHEQRAKVRGHRSAQARLGIARGRLLGAAGDIVAARRTFEKSLSLLDGLPLRYDTACVNFAYGQTLRRAGKRRDADAVIGAARDGYASLGAATYVARCDRELRAGGFNQIREPQDGVTLTPQEDAVATLVAKGLSNREAAAELYVSTKTVQYHLTRIYAKLGVRTRSELAALRR